MQKISHRQFTKRTALVSLGLPWLKKLSSINFITRPASAPATPSSSFNLEIWFSSQCCRLGEILDKGGTALDAVEAGARVPEANPEVRSVGYGGLPNENGEVELDASIMDGRTENAGAVAAL